MVEAYLVNEIDYDQIHYRLSALYKRVIALREQSSAEGHVSLIKASNLNLDDVLRSRLDAVEDAQSGLSYAVWVIGETLCAIGGTELMQTVASRFEDEHQSRGAVWLDHRWSDVRARRDIWLA